ncbi:hypothetical protein CR194_14300 [Salipaludibacillus keqinensis]|uniref:DUF8042 domain-containing protein n=1 Tax=Salipaludibacillus keqinensis TaxID=2045207 RepID=A0A323TGX8_9BACI|nr:hypothetical protein [Salipaludibacillus keqinensis]PYZ92817.1 hypothetical protein CR194_14300 [Salipaludibacillus keqinensis]
MKNYQDLLTEVESAIQYVSECYIKDDHDIGDRLLKSVMLGLIPYNEENLTIQSIMHHDRDAMNHLTKFQEAVRWAVNVDEVFPDEQQRMRFIHETLLPRKQKWKAIIDKYLITH